MASIIVRSPPSARVQIQRRRRRWFFWLHMNSLRRIALSLLLSHLLRNRRVGEEASEITVRRATLARVCGRSGFWEHTRDCSLHPLDQRWSSSSSLAPFEGLHCVHLPASTVYDYNEHTHEMSRVNGSTDVLSICPSAGYTLIFVSVHVLLLFTAYMNSDTHMHIHVVTYITLVF
jgi:hypothetical protein